MSMFLATKSKCKLYTARKLEPILQLSESVSVKAPSKFVARQSLKLYLSLSTNQLFFNTSRRSC